MTVKFRDMRIQLSIDPETALAELERIRIEHEGRLTSRAVVDASQHKTAPLHGCFEWRNRVAANAYRQWQARNLIKSMRIEHIDEQGRPHDFPCFVNVRITGADSKAVQYYQSTQVAIQHLDEWTAAVHGVQMKLESAQKAVDDLQRVAAGDSDRMGRITLAVRSIDAAIAALRH